MDFRERVARLSEQSKRDEGLIIHPEEYIVYSGEFSWWEIEEPRERHRVRCRQRRRAQYKANPGKLTEAIKRSTQRHPETQKKYYSTHVGAYVGSRKLQWLYAPYKRQKHNICELCGSRESLGWHHWTNDNPSMGMWVCPYCNIAVEAIDIGGWTTAARYISCKEELDREYADGEIVRLAKMAKKYRRLYTTVDGVCSSYPAWGKRNKPESGLCELCDTFKVLHYHHWDDDILGKGLWACKKCHNLAERLDVYGLAFVENYLSLKAQDELRVLRLMEAS